MSKRKMLILIASMILVGGYLLMMGAVYFGQEGILFYPRKLDENADRVFMNATLEITLENEGVSLHGWLVNPGQERLILYYGGNGEEVSCNIEDFKKIGGYTTLIMNYRGYGKSEGAPGQSALFADALALFDQITDRLKISHEHVVLFGRSLGSGIAVYVSSKRAISKLILVTPFDSIRNVVQSRFPIFPITMMLKHPFDSIRHSEKVFSSALFMVAGGDTIIPNHFSRNLADHWKGNRQVVVLESVGHNTIQTHPLYWKSIFQFIQP